MTNIVIPVLHNHGELVNLNLITIFKFCSFGTNS